VKYDVIIVGSGLGGLECGYILSKRGYNVCILEKNPQLGGCLQTFKRKGITFDTGFHFVGGLEEGQSLHKLFRYFDLLDLPWQKLDEEAFAEVIFNDKSYFFASGHERFVHTLAKDFPHQQKQLERYAAFLKKVGDTIESRFSPKATGDVGGDALFEQSAYAFLRETIDDPLLRNVLSGASLTMELCAETLPLYIFAQINNSFIQSAWRLRGGGSLIAQKLAQSISQMGGSIITNARVNRLTEKDGKIVAVEYNNDEQIEGQYIISNLHPALTLSLISESKHIRNVYRKRISNLPNTFGMFTTHLKVKENSIPYLNRNIYLYENQDVWDYCHYNPNNTGKGVLINYQIPENEVCTRNIDILTPVHWEEVAKWENTAVARRGDDYEQFKRQKAEEMIAFAAKRIPELNGNIEQYYTSSPLTYRDYTGTWQGSAYGIRKDCNRLLFTMLSPQTQISNLLLTGQNLNLHGILGVSMTSIFTCLKLAGMETLIEEINNC
jgi:all-trans-retinol 13,14-reductase